MSDPGDTNSKNGDELIGELFDDKYRISSKLGGGGMGLVFEAHHEWMERRVALKVLRPNFIDGDEYEIFLERFKREAQTASRINHPNAVTIYDFGIYKQMPFLAMQFIEGETLSDLIRAQGRMDEQSAVDLILQVIDAVADAHALQIIHRDIKPDNVMITKNADGSRNAHVLDFGIAKVLDSAESSQVNMTLPGKAVGTPRYMSPEQVLAKPIDARTDIYALGVVLYEMLSGDIPFKADSSMQLMFHHVNTAPAPIKEICELANTSKRIEKLVMKALEKEPEKRFQSAVEMREALAAAVEKSSDTKSNISGIHPSAIFSQKPVLNRYGIALLGASILGLAFLFLGGSEQADTNQATRLALSRNPVETETEIESAPNPPSSVAAEKEDEPPQITESTNKEIEVKEDPAGVKPATGSAPAAEVNPPEVEQSTTAEKNVEGTAEKTTEEESSDAPTTKASQEDVKSESRVAVEESPALENKSPVQEPSPQTSVQASPEAKVVKASQSETVQQEASPAPAAQPELSKSVDAAKPLDATDSKTAEKASAMTAAATATPSPEEVAAEDDKATSEKVTASPSETLQVAKAPEKKKLSPEQKPEPKESEPKEPDRKSRADNPYQAASIDKLISHLAGEDRKARELAAIELQKRGNKPVAALVKTLESHKSPRARFWAVFILGKLRAKEATPAIEKALQDPSGMVSQTAKKALRAVNPTRANKVLGADENRPKAGSSDDGFLGLF